MKDKKLREAILKTGIIKELQGPFSWLGECHDIHENGAGGLFVPFKVMQILNAILTYLNVEVISISEGIKIVKKEPINEKICNYCKHMPGMAHTFCSDCKNYSKFEGREKGII